MMVLEFRAREMGECVDRYAVGEGKNDTMEVRTHHDALLRTRIYIFLKR
jgi:hypothetical protein